MKRQAITALPDKRIRCAPIGARRHAGRIPVVFLVLAGFIAGGAIGGFCVFRAVKGTQTTAAPGGQNANNAVTLSERSAATVKDLNAPIEIRFYSILDPSTVPDAMNGFAARVDKLLSEYQEKGGGKIKVTRVDARSYAAAKDAQADGIKPFNIDKGDACYLGIAVARDGQKQVFAQLSPEGEGSLETDLTKAIATLTPAAAAAPAAKVDAAAVEQVKQAVPDLASVSLEEGTKILREAAVKEFADTAREIQNRVKEAQDRLVRAQNGGSAAEQQEAMKQLQDVQVQQTEQLKQIAARSQAQIDAFRQLKAAK